jgi:hypothetical protein
MPGFDRRAVRLRRRRVGFLRSPVYARRLVFLRPPFRVERRGLRLRAGAALRRRPPLRVRKRPFASRFGVARRLRRRRGLLVALARRTRRTAEFFFRLTLRTFFLREVWAFFRRLRLVVVRGYSSSSGFNTMSDSRANAAPSGFNGSGAGERGSWVFRPRWKLAQGECACQAFCLRLRRGRPQKEPRNDGTWRLSGSRVPWRAGTDKTAPCGGDGPRSAARLLPGMLRRPSSCRNDGNEWKGTLRSSAPGNGDMRGNLRSRSPG